MQSSKKIPRKLWILWHQGIDNAPFVVKKCIESWRTKNPTWEITLLDGKNLSDYITLGIPNHQLKQLSITKQSNLIRLQLLDKYGGVWADATTLCLNPLDNWIDEYCQSGFFAFSNAGKDREMANWFLASERDCPLTKKMLIEYRSFFTKNSFNNNGYIKERLIKRLSKYFNSNKERTSYWLSPFVTKILRIYPYFIFHYLFYRLICTDQECKGIWHKTLKVSPNNSRKVQSIGLLSKLTNETILNISSNIPHLYKLTWKYRHINYKENTLLHYILEGQDN